MNTVRRNIVRPSAGFFGPNTRFSDKPLTELGAKLDTYWKEVKGDLHMPQKKKLSPQRLPVPLDQVALVRIDREGSGPSEQLDFYFSIHGTSITKLVGKEFQGQHLSKVPVAEDVRGSWKSVYSVVAKNAGPYHMCSPFPRYTRLTGSCACAFFPFGEGSEASHVLAFLDTMPGTIPIKEQVGKLVQRMT